MSLQDARSQYNEVFGVLLELRIMSFQLQDFWLDAVHRHGDPQLPHFAASSSLHGF